MASPEIFLDLNCDLAISICVWRKYQAYVYALVSHFTRVINYRRDGVVVRATASLSVDLGFISPV